MGIIYTLHFFQNIGVKEEKMGHFLGQKIFICNFFFV